MIGIVTGLTAEARISRPLGTSCIGGGTPAGAAHAAETLLANGATALISFGFAGGLNPALAPGTLIIPACIRTAHADHPTDPALTASLGGPIHTLCGGTEVAVTAAAKAAMWRATGADAIDLESGAVAEAAAARGVAFAVLRAICDPADSTLPPAAIIALDAAGAITLARVAASVVRHPGQLWALLRLAGHAAVARSALARRVREVGQIRSE
jgi:adenosylhomocysteine nucleosidase